MKDFNYRIYTEPFIHVVMEPPAEIYEYANSIFPDPPSTIEGIRTNINLLDETVSIFIKEATDLSNSLFLNDIKQHYPSLQIDHLNLKDRYLWSHNTTNSNEIVPRGLHLDNGTKFIIGLWYFKDQLDKSGGDLFLANPTTNQTKLVRYSTNTMILFPNLTTSWHAVTKRKQSSIPRRFINIIRESDTALHSYNKVSNDEPKEKVINFFV